MREALPYEWMKTTWERWAETVKLGDTLEDRYTPFDINNIKAGNVLGWRGELERQAASGWRGVGSFSDDWIDRSSVCLKLDWRCVLEGCKIGRGEGR